MKIFIVYTDNIFDCSGELLSSGSNVRAFDSLVKANNYIDEVEETYMLKRSDYSIDEMDIS